MNSNKFELDIDIKQPTYVTDPVFKQHDDVTFVINITDNGVPLDLTGVTTSTLSVARPDRVTVTSDGENTGTNQITFKLPRASAAIIGRSAATVQLYGADKRVSTFTFPVKVEKDPSSGLNVTAGEKTLIEKVLGDGPGIIQSAEDAAAEAQHWSNEVENVLRDVSDVAPRAEAATSYVEEKKSLIEKSIADASEAKTTAETVRSEFDQVVAEAGSNNPEVVQARGGAVNLNARLDGVTQQLADIPYLINKDDNKKYTVSFEIYNGQPRLAYKEVMV